MTCSDCTPRLNDYVDATLSPAELAAVDAHLAHCPCCRAALSSLRQLRTLTQALPRELEPPRDLWPELSAQLAPPPATLFLRVVDFRASFIPLAVAASVALLCSLVSPTLPARATWSVAATSGAPRVAARTISGDAPFRLGDWLETDADSRARVAVGSIGEVRVAPNSRVRLAGATARDHRLELKRGTLDALIWAAPRLFFVDTPSATAVDLGCAYTLTVDDQGHGELVVTAGYVALEHGDREAIIPSGTKCLTRKGAGPGTPFSIHASASFRAALEAFDFGPPATRSAAVDSILAQARRDDEVTLWHLLARTTGAQRAATFDTLARVSHVPEGITREGILRGDAQMRRAWGTALGLGPY